MERSLHTRSHQWALPLVLILLFVMATWPALEVVGARWLKFDESYSHGFLILIVSTVLAFRKWVKIRPQVGFYPFWLLPLAASAVVYLAGSVLLMEALQQVALLPLLFGLLLIIWGWRQTSSFFLILGLLAFALPVWDYLSWPLQLITVSVTQFFLSLLDINFVVEGVFVFFPGVGAFEIAHGCSGLRYLLVGLTLVTLYGELNYCSLKPRVFLAAVGLLLALAANWIRVFVIIYVGYESNMTSSLINEHDHFGWWVFAGTLVPLFLIAQFLERSECIGGRSKEVASVVTSGTSSAGLAIFGIVLPMLALVAASWWLQLQQQTVLATGERQETRRFIDDERWLPVFENNIEGWRPLIQRPDRANVSVYAERLNDQSLQDREAAGTELFTGVYTYDFQRPGGELVQYSNRLYDKQKMIPESTFNVNAGPGLSLSGVTLKYRQTDARLHLAYGYYVEGRWETNELQAKLAQLPGVFNSRNDASLLLVAISCSDCAGAEWLNDLVPDIRKKVEGHLDKVFAEGGPS